MMAEPYTIRGACLRWCAGRHARRGRLDLAAIRTPFHETVIRRILRDREKRANEIRRYGNAYLKGETSSKRLMQIWF
jgi:hypothetical protein